MINISLSGVGNRDPSRKSSSYVDPTTRRCPICKKHYTIFQMAENGNKTPCCGVHVLS